MGPNLNAEFDWINNIPSIQTLEPVGVACDIFSVFFNPKNI